MSTQQQFNKSTSEIYKKISKHVPEIEWKIHAPTKPSQNIYKRYHLTLSLCFLYLANKT